MADFGQFNFGQSIFCDVLLCVVLLCVVVCCCCCVYCCVGVVVLVLGVGVGCWFWPPCAGPPKISLFIFPLPPPFSLFLSLSGCLLVDFCVFSKAGALKCARLWCETPAASGLPGVHTTTRELQTCTFEGSGASNTTKFPREDTQRERQKKSEISGGSGEKKKREILGPPTLRCSIFLGLGSTLWGLTMTHTPDPEMGWPKIGLAKTGLAEVGLFQMNMSKSPTYTAASSVVRAAPFVLRTAVGSSDLRIVSCPSGVPSGQKDS